MNFSDFSERNSFIHRSDPRLRLLIFSAFSIFCCITSSFIVLAVLLLLGLSSLYGAGLSLSELRGRLLALNIFLLFFYLSGLLSAYLLPGQGNFDDLFYLLVAMRSNAIILLGVSLVSSMDPVTLGHALAHLRMPRKLACLFLFSVRQLELIHREYLFMKNAMKARAFRAGWNMHTYRTLSVFAALLLLRSLERAERVSKAMDCRCFSGHFYMMYHFKFKHSDLYFGLAAFIFLAMLIGGDFLCRIY